MARDDYLELKGICQFEMKIDLTYRSIEGPTAYVIKAITFENSISDFKCCLLSPVVKWSEDFAVISIGKEPVFDDEAQRIIDERLDRNGNMLAYCNEESLAIIVSSRLMHCQTLVKMFTEFFSDDRWVSYYDDNKVKVSATPHISFKGNSINIKPATPAEWLRNAGGGAYFRKRVGSAFIY